MTARRTRGAIRQAGSSIVLQDGATGQTTIQAASTASRTLTLPDATDTLAGLAATQTLSNKTFVAPALGTPASAVLTNATGLPLTTGVTGTLPVANGGTGVTSKTGTGSVVLSNSPALVTPDLGTPSAAVLTNATGLPLTTGVTGTLPVANGGTGGTTSTGTGAVVLATSPTLVTPNLGTPSALVLTNATGLPIAGGGTGQTTAAAAFKALAQYAAKGDLPGYNGTTAGILTVGADGTVLTADAASTYGLKWTAPLTNPMTAAGDMIYGGASGAATKLATGATAGVLHGGNGATPSWSQIVDADVSASAAISGSKLQAANGTSNAGAVSTGSQTLGGLKTFSTGIALPTSGGTASTLDFYEVYTLSTTFQGSGGGVVSTSKSITITRIGKTVTMYIPSFSDATTGSSSTAVTNNSAIPARFCPPGNVNFSINGIVVSGSNTAGGLLQITSAGAINIYRDLATTAYPNAGGNGIINTAVTWVAA